MAIKCDICGEEVNHFRTFCFLVTGTLGSMVFVTMFTGKTYLHWIFAFAGLLLGMWVVYSFNTKHVTHLLKTERQGP